jgi:CheY-like chemotaxis protein
VDLLLTDMTFPNGLSGCDLALQLRQSRPGLKVVYTSGATGDTADQDPALWEGLKILSKPYSADTLLQAVQDSLDS